MEKVEPEVFFKKIEIFLILIIIFGSLLCFLVSRSFMNTLAFLSGGLLGFLNFRSTKKEGITFIKKIQENLRLHRSVSMEKERNIFLFKLFLKLLATGIVLFILIAKFHLHPVIILLSFFTIYTSIVLMSLKYLLLDKILI